MAFRECRLGSQIRCGRCCPTSPIPSLDRKTPMCLEIFVCTRSPDLDDESYEGRLSIVSDF